jgi:hypothetical protein
VVDEELCIWLNRFGPVLIRLSIALWSDAFSSGVMETDEPGAAAELLMTF